MMKSIHIFFVLLISCSAVVTGWSQGKFGSDSATCVTNLSFYRDYAMQEKYKEALPYWRKAMQACPPAASQYLYIDGVKIMKYLINDAKDAMLRKSRIDSLFMMYDRRMAHFKVNTGNVYRQKAYDVVQYMKDDELAIYKAFEAAVLAGGSKTEARTMIDAMNAAIKVYDNKRLSAGNFMEFYNKLRAFADTQAKERPNDAQAKRLPTDLENLFVGSGGASCDNMIAMYEKEFKAAPNSKEVVSRILQMMRLNKCTQNELYYQVVEAYHKLEPSAGSAYAIAVMYVMKNDMTNAVKYYKEAVERSTSQKDKAKYMADLGIIYMQKFNDRTQALHYAKQAIENDARNGKAYLLRGMIWAAEECGGNTIAKKAKYWLAVDYAAKAKSIDPSLAAEANQYINAYSQYFPEQQDAFMYDLVDGNTYEVNCNDMTERTRVRTRK
jgi:tetratricopeptide (TPR) repeat protein